MESTGAPHRIHVSQETANHISAGGKGKWLIPREETVFAKGKGQLQTYWIQIRNESQGSMAETMSVSLSLKDDEFDIKTYKTQHPVDRMRLLAALSPSEDVAQKNKRLVTWNVEILSRLLKQVVARRLTYNKSIFGAPVSSQVPKRTKSFDSNNPLEEVVDVLDLPRFEENHFKNHVDPDTIVLPERVMSQLIDYVARIANLYNNNPFHSFEHASHVTLSVTKLLGRVVNPAEISRTKGPEYKFASVLHGKLRSFHFCCLKRRLIDPRPAFRPHLWHHIRSINAFCSCLLRANS